MKGLFKVFNNVEIQTLLDQLPVFHPDFEGNLKCRFLSKESRCSIHPFRSLACRIHGLPVIDQLKISGQENCRKINPAVQPRVSVNELRGWLELLTRLNKDHFDFYCEPYWVSGFNIECWFAIIFDPFLDMDVFGELKRQLLDLFPELKELQYDDPTDLKGKVDDVTLFYEIMKFGITGKVIGLLDKIISGYPQTGTYYLKEASDYRKIMVEKLKEG